MRINHVHFYVHDAEFWRDWFMRVLNFLPIQSYVDRYHQTRSEVMQHESICFVLSSPLSDASSIAPYLQKHPSGVADVAFEVTNLEQVLIQAQSIGNELSQSIRSIKKHGVTIKFCQIQGWGDLKHTLIERIIERTNEPISEQKSERFANRKFERISEVVSELASEPVSELTTPFYLSLLATNAEPLLGRLKPLSSEKASLQGGAAGSQFVGIDHIVLNVEVGDLQRSTDFYETIFGFQRQQRFMIQTKRSALSSQVLMHPQGEVQLPINEPASAQSQVQEFLSENRGAGVQHLALRTRNIVSAIAQLRQQGLPFLSVPQTYYEQLQQRIGFPLTDLEWRSIAEQEVLVDWQADEPNALLLQTFTHPIFSEPTFFFEIIERRQYWTGDRYQTAQGFGEGNFQALFEAIEREQMKRGTLD